MGIERGDLLGGFSAAEVEEPIDPEAGRQPTPTGAED
jgi:hypothetical protein